MYWKFVSDENSVEDNLDNLVVHDERRYKQTLWKDWCIQNLRSWELLLANIFGLSTRIENPFVESNSVFLSIICPTHLKNIKGALRTSSKQ